MALREEEIIAECKLIKIKNLKVVVLCAIFSSLDNDGIFEERAAAIIRRELPRVKVVCSRDSKRQMTLFMLMAKFGYFSWPDWLPRARECHYSEWCHPFICAQGCTRLSEGYGHPKFGVPTVLNYQ